MVLTQWDWGGAHSYIHDEVAADKRNPTIGARGRVYGVDFTGDSLLWVDPVEHTSGSIAIPVLAAGRPVVHSREDRVAVAVLGEKAIFNNPVHPHNPMMDQRQRVWMTAAVRPSPNPEYCKGADGNAFGKNYPMAQSSRQAAVYDPRTQKTTPVDTCYATHHLQFAEDKDNTLYFSGDTNVIGWINTRIWDETGDAAKAQGWCPLDRRHERRRQDRRLHAAEREAAIRRATCASPASPYGIIVNPTDGSIWYANAGVPGRIGRLELGSNPPLTCKTEVFEPPYNPPNVITGVHAARHRRRSQRRALDRPVGRPAHGVVRPPQVQDAERPDRHGPALRRRLDALSGARAADEGRPTSPAAPTSRTTTGSISSTRSASARTCRS